MIRGTQYYARLCHRSLSNPRIFPAFPGKWRDGIPTRCTLLFVSSRVVPLSGSPKKHLTSSGGRQQATSQPASQPTRRAGRQTGRQAARVVRKYIPVAGESSQVLQQMGAFTRESVIKAVYHKCGLLAMTNARRACARARVHNLRIIFI